MHLASREHRPLLYFISFVALFRLLVAPHLGLGADEAHYLIYALNLDWSYFDHPPLVGWVQYLFTSIFGIDELGSRISAITIGFFTSIFVYKLIYQINSDAKLAFISILALNAMFIFNALFLMLMPDTLLFLLIVPIIFSVNALQKNDSLKNWFVLGVLVGLAGLSKYTAVLFIPPIIIYFILKKNYKLFISPKILVAIGVALFIVSPVLYWNMQNDWISFTYQSHHVVGSSHINWMGFMQSLVAQLIAYNPFLFGLSFYGLYRAFKSQNEVLFIAALFGATLLIFFTYSSLYKTALPHWSALFYLLFIPIGTYYLYEKSLSWRRYLQFAIAFGLLLSSLLYIEIATKIIPLPDENSIQLDVYGFEKIMKEANAQIKDPKTQAIGVTLWTLASRAIVYNEHYDSEVYLLDDRYDQFDIWETSSPKGKDMIVIDINFAHKDLATYMKCDTLQKLSAFKLLETNTKESVTLYKCTNYQGIR
ncbi:glycosyltransferase family 39 protein [Sulfurimonas sp. SAG-AH-194-L11]|nr:glycosyltransferase family 39 protein [Sulfurimonas sp. SAG-AH-194-L11]MDF1877630.1 glycosyltransferase family 39 protein [Sulfurimonas sp. SAG-AH-194-L11]